MTKSPSPSPEPSDEDNCTSSYPRRSPAATPISTGGRHRPSHATSRSKNTRPLAGVGGYFVGSMRNGLKLREDDRGARRLNLLLTFALVLFVILTTAWILRITSRIEQIGGWAKILGRLRKLLGDKIGPVMKEWSAGNDQEL